ncbi:MAG: BspA family leucine-rich repeat surface protein, partial [Romboutsia sp.]|nr:BspA family leucine-rich repeat surface protein [Romboutsia sp.]
ESRDKGDSSKFSNTMNYAIGDTLTIWHYTPSRVAIKGKEIKGAREDYSNGVDNAANLTEAVFRFTDNGLEAVYKDAPKITGVKDTKVLKGQTLNLRDLTSEIQATDTIDGNITHNVICDYSSLVDEGSNNDGVFAFGKNPIYDRESGLPPNQDIITGPSLDQEQIVVPNKVGMYEVRYSVTNSNDRTAIKSSTVVVYDKPTIEPDPIYSRIELNSIENTEEAIIERLKQIVVVRDEDDELYGKETKLEILSHNVNPNEEGIYQATYRATDLQGAVTEVTIDIEVSSVPVTIDDWVVEPCDTDINSIVITRYVGSNPQVVIPRRLIGRTVILKDLNKSMFPEGITSLTVRVQEDEDKIQIENSNLFNAFIGVTTLESVDLSGLDTSTITNINSMFEGCSNLTSANLTGWDTSKVESFEELFRQCSSLTTIEGIESWNTSLVQNMGGMFDRCSSLTELNINDWNTSTVAKMASMFNGCSSLTRLNIANWNTSLVTDMSYMFNGCSALSQIDVGNWVTSQVRNMRYMFKGCSGLTGLNVANWNTSQVADMVSMFYGCSQLTQLDITNWNTSLVTNMDTMFTECINLTNITFGVNWNTSRVTNMVSMFRGCSNLTSIDVSNWNVSKVANMDRMFEGCTRL